jgi:oligopeptidase A
MFARQIYFGALDMELHSRFDPKSDSGDGSEIFKTQREISEIYNPHMSPIEDDRFLCSFAHIFGGGYAAGYYSYKWAEIMSADAFSAFEDVGLDNKVEIEKLGRKFRKTVLGSGGGKAPSEVFKEFRGRDAKPDALLRHLGLSEK